MSACNLTRALSIKEGLDQDEAGLKSSSITRSGNGAIEFFLNNKGCEPGLKQRFRGRTSIRSDVEGREYAQASMIHPKDRSSMTAVCFLSSRDTGSTVFAKSMDGEDDPGQQFLRRELRAIEVILIDRTGRGELMFLHPGGHLIVCRVHLTVRASVDGGDDA